MFKKILQSIVVIVMLLGCSGTDKITSQTQTFTSEEQVAKHMLSLFKNLDNMTFEQYEKHLATTEQVLAAVRENLTGEALRKMEKSVNSWVKRRLESFNRIKENRKKYDIIWDDIDVKAVTNCESNKLPNAYTMKIFFIYKGNYFFVKGYPLKLNGVFMLAGIINIYHITPTSYQLSIKECGQPIVIDKNLLQ